MGCRRAYDTDLGEFVRDPGGSEWTAFRLHYAGCPECSAEVRAWTELHTLLQGEQTALPEYDPGLPHPAPERLLQFEEAPGSLPAAERQLLERHLARCRSCADELAALRRFDLAAIKRVAPARRVRRVASVADLFAVVRRAVFHPAFAYALVLLLLYPTVAKHVPRRQTAPHESAPSPADREESVRSFSNADLADEAIGERAPMDVGTGPSRQSALLPEPRIAAQPLAKHRGLDQEPMAKLKSGPSERAQQSALPPVAASATQQGERSDTVPAARDHALAAPAKGAAATGRADAVAEDDAMVLERHEQSQRRPARSVMAGSHTDPVTKPGWAVAVLDPTTTVHIETPRWGTDVTLRVPVPDIARKYTELELRVFDARGRREVRERTHAATDSSHVDLQLPAYWLTAADYRVEMRAAASGTVLAAFTLRVR